MGVAVPRIFPAKQILNRILANPGGGTTKVPKGHFAVYVGETSWKRYVLPLSYLNHPSSQHLLSQAEEEFGYHHPMGALTIPCKEETFINLTCNLCSP
ncbi:auxin-responsive protein SAUR21-like [Coffea eugenioides]|uniref:auxin-responsive protein SAUR21-like n=1 Tax=Coffea eugenioides TaxID=49369 RepID=UPI000F607C82|nr:auxin-responsive protein SAUR21-like [Coffea eugenioides]